MASPSAQAFRPGWVDVWAALFKVAASPPLAAASVALPVGGAAVICCRQSIHGPNACCRYPNHSPRTPKFTTSVWYVQPVIVAELCMTCAPTAALCCRRRASSACQGHWTMRHSLPPVTQQLFSQRFSNVTWRSWAPDAATVSLSTLSRSEHGTVAALERLYCRALAIRTAPLLIAPVPAFAFIFSL